jgi:hypothetical protein
MTNKINKTINKIKEQIPIEIRVKISFLITIGSQEKNKAILKL